MSPVTRCRERIEERERDKEAADVPLIRKRYVFAD